MRRSCPTLTGREGRRRQVDSLPRRHAGGVTMMLPSALDGRVSVDQLMAQMQQRGVPVHEAVFSPAKRTTTAAADASDSDSASLLQPDAPSSPR